MPIFEKSHYAGTLREYLPLKLTVKITLPNDFIIEESLAYDKAIELLEDAEGRQAYKDGFIKVEVY